MPRPARARPVVVVVGVVLILLGILAMFTIGFPVLLAGLFVLLAGTTDAHRRHPQVFWPMVATAATFLVGYVLAAPLTCTSRATVTDGAEEVGGTTCSNLVGIEYAGDREYDPPLWPAAAVGVVGGALAGTLTWRWLRGPRQDPDGSAP